MAVGPTMCIGDFAFVDNKFWNVNAFPKIDGKISPKLIEIF
jgi:hypothetical protein